MEQINQLRQKFPTGKQIHFPKFKMHALQNALSHNFNNIVTPSWEM